MSGGGLELRWPGKFSEAGGRRPIAPPRVAPAGWVAHEENGSGGESRLMLGDNLDALHALLPTHEGRVDLVYIDPPFATGGRFDVARRVGDDPGAAPVSLPAYDDRFEGGAAGLCAALDDRLRLIHRLLAPHGSLYVHVDPTVGHAVKLMLDEIFGPRAFQREIVWRIGWVSGFKSNARNWIRNHDLIYYYTKDPKHFTFNRQELPHPEGYRRRDGKPPRGTGVPIEDVWNANEAELALRGRDSLASIQIKSFSREKTGWATQKNEALMRRIIAASSNPGDLVLDAYGGSGTTARAAAELGRRFVSCDRSAIATELARARLREVGAPFEIWAPTDQREYEENAAGQLRARLDPGSGAVSLVGLDPRPATLERLAAAGVQPPADGLDLVCAWCVSAPGPFRVYAGAERTLFRRDLPRRLPLSAADMAATEGKFGADPPVGPGERPCQLSLPTEVLSTPEAMAASPEDRGARPAELWVRVYDIFGQCSTTRVSASDSTPGTG